MTRFSFSRLGIFGFFFRSNAAARRAARFTFRSLGIARRFAAIRRTAARAVEVGASRRGRQAGSCSSGWTRRSSPRGARSGGFFRRTRTAAESRRRRGSGHAPTQLTAERLEGRALLAATTPPFPISLTPVGGTVIADTLNATNTDLQIQATIVAGEATGGSAEFYIGTTLIGTDPVIAAGDTTVDFSEGTLTAAALQAVITSGGAVSVKLIDSTSGSVTSTANPTLTVDYIAPTAPAAPAEQGTTKLGDNFLNITEAATSTTFRVSLGTSGAALNDTVELLIGGVSFATPKTVVLSGTDIANGYVDFTVSSADLGADGSKSLTAQVTDKAGNAGPAGAASVFTKDTIAPTAPAAPAEQGTTKLADGKLDILEYQSPTTFRVSLGGSGAVVNDTVELLLGGVSFGTPKTKTLAAIDMTNGYVDFTVSTPDLGADGSKSLSAHVTDVAGNVGASSSALTFTLNTNPAVTSINGGPVATPAIRATPVSTIGFTLAPPPHNSRVH